jgi:type VI protein secretion system component VasK
MRMHDIGQVLIVLALGFLLGGLTTFFTYNAIINRRIDSERRQNEQTIQDADQEREQLQRQLDLYHQDELDRRQAADQGADDPPPPKVVGAKRRPGDLKSNDQ